jgi:hypothetical protein
VLWTLRDTTTPELRREMLRGLAFLCLECLDVREGDYGQDLFGGSHPMREIKPWERTPRWRTPDGPPANYDMALHLDFDDWAGHDAYGTDPTHDATAAFNERVSWEELTARVDWWYEGPTLSRRGGVRHVAMLLWDDDATETAKRRAQDDARRLEAQPGVEHLSIGENVGRLTTDFDWILDIQLAGVDETRSLLDGEPYAAAMRSIAQATKFEWTARLSHVMRGG